MLLPAGFGVDTMLHELPFQCAARVAAAAVPTAQTSVAEMAATEVSRLADGSGLGLLAIDQPEDGAGVGVGVGVGDGDGRGWAATAVASVRRRAALPKTPSTPIVTTAANAPRTPLVFVGFLGSMGASILLPLSWKEVAAAPDGVTINVTDDGSKTST